MPIPALMPATQRLTPGEGVSTYADGAGAGGGPAAAETEGGAKPKLLEVKSPMVGTFYAAPEPGAKPYVTEGTSDLEG